MLNEAKSNVETQEEKELKSLQSKLQILRCTMPFDDEESTNEEKSILKRLVKLKHMIEYLSEITLKRQKLVSELHENVQKREIGAGDFSTSLLPIKIEVVKDKLPLQSVNVPADIGKLLEKITKRTSELKLNSAENDTLFFEFQKVLSSKVNELEKLLDVKIDELDQAKKRTCQCVLQAEKDLVEHRSPLLGEDAVSCTCLKKHLEFKIIISELKSKNSKLEIKLSNLSEAQSFLKDQSAHAVAEKDQSQRELIQKLQDECLHLRSLNEQQNQRFAIQIENIATLLADNGIYQAHSDLNNTPVDQQIESRIQLLAIDITELIKTKKSTEESLAQVETRLAQVLQALDGERLRNTELLNHVSQEQILSDEVCRKLTHQVGTLSFDLETMERENVRLKIENADLLMTNARDKILQGIIESHSKNLGGQVEADEVQQIKEP